MYHRRSFLKNSFLASTSALIPAFLKNAPVKASKGSRDETILIVIQLSGGNDGLNTVVPYRNDLYYQYRPEIKIAPGSLIKLSDELGFNAALQPLAEFFEQGELSVLNEVGYPNPDRSHFRSMDIWHTGCEKEYLQTGWLGRYLDSDCDECQRPYHAIEVGDNVSLALHGQYRDALAMRGPEKLQRATSDPFLRSLGKKYKPEIANTELDFLYKTMVEVQESAAYLTKQAKAYRSLFSYPNHAFGEGMRQIAELIIADTNTKIYYISLPGFDTHVNQKARQHNLLSIYAQSVNTFIRDLKSNGLFEDILIMTFSEFGRRVQENGSLGTDHGAANNVFFLGDKLQTPGFYNDAPDLIRLDDGDLSYKVDFRAIYGHLLENWLNTDPNSILGMNLVLPKRLV